MTGKSYRLRNHAAKLPEESDRTKTDAPVAVSTDAQENPKAAKVITGSEEVRAESKAAKVIIAGKKRPDSVVAGSESASK